MGADPPAAATVVAEVERPHGRPLVWVGAARVVAVAAVGREGAGECVIDRCPPTAHLRDLD
jgi:hypothetical protein